MSVIHDAPRGVAGTTRKNEAGPFSALPTTASSSSSDVAVRFATTRTFAFSSPMRTSSSGT
jgi:hypothetical protein